jgi:hypothetical protein
MEGTLVVEHLPELGEAFQYQLWFIWNGKRTSGGVFRWMLRDMAIYT